MNYNKVSTYCVDRFLSNSNMKSDCRNIYIYGMEILLSSIVNFLFILLLSLLLQIQKEILVYLLFFVPLRIFSGGRHARTHFRCIGFFTAAMLFCIAFSSILIQMPSIVLWKYCLTGLLLTSIFIIQKYAAKFKKTMFCKEHHFISCLVGTGYIAILLFLMLIMPGQKLYLLIGGCAMFIQSISLLPFLQK